MALKLEKIFVLEAQYMNTVKIGAGQGFWGDSPYPALDVIREEGMQYLCCDVLAETTLGVLQKAKQKNDNLGFVTDLFFQTVLQECMEKKVVLITNHGGLNPQGAAYALQKICEDKGLKPKIAIIEGDNILQQLTEMCDDDEAFKNLETGESINRIGSDNILFANAYIGAIPIVDALKQQVDVVITGRVADASLFLAPMIYELDWESSDWDKLASGALIGHLMECSAQSTGGNFSGCWKEIPNMDRPGYPVVEVAENGSALLSKPKNTGGLVNTKTVTEQLVYEVLDPNNYYTPDVTVDFTSVILSEVAENVVKIEGVRGKRKSKDLKVVIGYHNGYANECGARYSWPDAFDKARKAEKIIKKQIDRLGIKFDEIITEYIGLNSLLGPVADISETLEINEVGLRMAVRTFDKKSADMFPRLFPSLALNGPPSFGAFGGGGGLQKTRELLGIWPTLIPRDQVEPRIKITIREV
jgi:hypothetical protein